MSSRRLTSSGVTLALGANVVSNVMMVAEVIFGCSGYDLSERREAASGIRA